MTLTPPAMSVRKTSAIGALLIALGPISLALYTPAMPQLVAAFGTEVSTVKLTMTVYFAGFALAQLICGPLSDAYGRRPIVIAFSILYLGGSLMAALAPSIEVLLLARVVQGVGAAAGIAITRAIVRDLYVGEQSAQIMNLIGLMLSVAPALSPAVGGIVLELLGWHAIFALMVVYGLVVLALFLTVVPETLAHRDHGAARPARLAASYGRLLRDVRFMRPSIIIGCTNGSLFALATMLPFVLMDVVGLSPTEFGMGMLAQSGAFLVGSIMVRQLLKSVPAHRLVPVGLGFIAAGGVLLAVLTRTVEPTFFAVMGPVSLIPLGLAFTMPSMLTESLAPFPEMAGAASALGGFMQMGGGLLGSAAAAAMGEPVLALGTIIPIMAAVAVVTYVGLKPFVPQRQEVRADQAVKRAVEESGEAELGE